MKKLVFLIAIHCLIKLNAQPYSISFAGAGALTTVGTIKVENLTSGTTLTLRTGEILHLSGTIGVYSMTNKQSTGMKIYPNPMTDNSILQIYPPEAGKAVIMVCDMTGKLVAQIQSYLENYLQEFRLSGIRRGFYLIIVKGNTYNYSEKLLCHGKADGIISIDKIINNQEVIEKKSKMVFNGGQTIIEMAYTSGDRLKFTGISGIYSTVVTDIPASDTTITFNFIACTDGDNNNYPIVEIGTQVWMAENLKTTKFNNGLEILNEEDNVAWNNLKTPAYCWYNNSESTYKTTYGALYNWYTVNTGNLCPTGWHVPSDDEWTAFTTYLGGTGVASGKLKELGTAHWNLPNTGATNETGYTALPGGGRVSGGTFDGLNVSSYLWSTTATNETNAWCRILNCTCSCVASFDDIKSYGFSVRCLKDL